MTCIILEGRPKEWSIWTKHLKECPEGWNEKEVIPWPEGTTSFSVLKDSNMNF